MIRVSPSFVLTVLKSRSGAMAASAGHEVIRVNPRFTTQACSHCGELIQKSLSVRTHMCTSCGYVADRDVNAAKNILCKAGAPPSDAKHSDGSVCLRSLALQGRGVVTQQRYSPIHEYTSYSPFLL